MPWRGYPDHVPCRRQGILKKDAVIDTSRGEIARRDCSKAAAGAAFLAKPAPNAWKRTPNSFAAKIIQPDGRVSQHEMSNNMRD